MTFDQAAQLLKNITTSLNQQSGDILLAAAKNLEEDTNRGSSTRV